MLRSFFRRIAAAWRTFWEHPERQELHQEITVSDNRRIAIEEIKEKITRRERVKRWGELAYLGITEADEEDFEETLPDDLLVYGGITYPCLFQEATKYPVGIQGESVWQAEVFMPGEAAQALSEWMTTSHPVGAVFRNESGFYSVSALEYQLHGDNYVATLDLRPMSEEQWESEGQPNFPQKLNLPEGLSDRIGTEKSLMQLAN